MAEEENRKKINPFFIYGLVIFLMILLGLSFVPNFQIAINNNQLVLIGIIVVLLLFGYFDIIEIPGFLKMSKDIKELRSEAQEIRTNQMNIMSAIAVNQNATATANNSVNIFNQAARDAGQEAQSLLQDLPSMPIADLPSSFTITRSASEHILAHAERREYSSAFLDLRRYTDDLLNDIFGRERFKNNIYELLRYAKKSGELYNSLVESISSVRKFGNVAIHILPSEEYKLYPQEVNEILDLGLRTIEELERIKNKRINNQ